jgi:proline racemase
VTAMRVIDSHTEGEPTRVIVSGGPDLGGGSLAARRAVFARDFDAVRRFAVLEPRGHDAMVGALLCEPLDRGCVAGVIFFNNVGMLGMCGHGTMGVAVTLAHLGRIGQGVHRLETPVGVVAFELLDRNTVRIENVPSWRFRKDIAVEVEGLGRKLVLPDRGASVPAGSAVDPRADPGGGGDPGGAARGWHPRRRWRRGGPCGDLRQTGGCRSRQPELRAVPRRGL